MYILFYETLLRVPNALLAVEVEGPSALARIEANVPRSLA